MKRGWEAVHLAVVVLFICLGFFAIWRIWFAVAIDVKSTKDFWDVATALGTCAAVIVALYTANGSNRTRKAESLSEARMVAAGVTFRIGIVLDAVKQAEAWAKQVSEFDGSPLTISQWEKRLSDFEICTLEENRALIPLPEHCADRLAGAKDRLQVAVYFLRTEGQNRETNPDSRKSAAHNAYVALMEASYLLNIAGLVCERESSAFKEGLPNLPLR